MSERPLISVVLPTHNGQRYLAQAVQAVMEQTYSHWELIIVDDASTDKTPKLIAELAKQDARIRPLRLNQNAKLPGALNAGFSQARGEYLTWTSDDNWHAPRALERMLLRLGKDSTCDFVYTDMELIDDNGKRIGFRPAGEPGELPLRNVVGACFLYRRKVWERVGMYNVNRFLIEDYDYWLRVSEQHCMVALQEPLYQYRIHANALTARRKECALAVQGALLDWIARPNVTDQQRAYAYVHLAAVAYEQNDYARGDESYLKAKQLLGRTPWLAGRRHVDIEHWLGPWFGKTARNAAGFLNALKRKAS